MLSLRQRLAKEYVKWGDDNPYFQLLIETFSVHFPKFLWAVLVNHLELTVCAKTSFCAAAAVMKGRRRIKMKSMMERREKECRDVTDKEDRKWSGEHRTKWREESNRPTPFITPPPQLPAHLDQLTRTLSASLGNHSSMQSLSQRYKETREHAKRREFVLAKPSLLAGKITVSKRRSDYEKCK